MEPGMDTTPQFDAGRLAVVTVGTGAPAVFVHGFGSDKTSWHALCEGLADVFTCHAIDLPGAGDSPAPRHFRYTLEQFADILTDFVVLKDLRRLTLVGASLGAAVILLALLRHREALSPRVRALCLIDAVAYPQDFPFFLEMLRAPLMGSLAVDLPSFLRDVPIPLPPGAAELARFYGRRRVRDAMVRTARLIDADSLEHYVGRLGTIDVPTLVLWGRKDGIVPVRLGRRLARELPNARLVVFDRCGHSPQTECPDKVIAALREFAAQTAPEQQADS
jgi:pimeloyl-ACP methyl ester carboxylesterase